MYFSLILSLGWLEQPTLRLSSYNRQKIDIFVFATKPYVIVSYHKASYLEVINK